MFGINPIHLLISLPGILIAISFHEFAHAYMADKLGDPTPRLQGRLTVYPLAHLDIIGFIMLMVAGFGWAKPVLINPRNFKKPRRDDILVSIAGPFSNLLIAIVFTGILKLFIEQYKIFGSNEEFVKNVFLLINYVILINLSLAIFNILPIPPLDGFHVLANTLPLRFRSIIDLLYRYGFLILIGLIIFSRASTGSFLAVPRDFLYTWLLALFGIR